LTDGIRDGLCGKDEWVSDASKPPDISIRTCPDSPSGWIVIQCALSTDRISLSGGAFRGFGRPRTAPLNSPGRWGHSNVLREDRGVEGRLMLARSRIFFYWLASLIALLASPAQAQQPPVTTLSNAQLEQLVAPIALYPDPLLSQILMASTYPTEVVQAE